MPFDLNRLEIPVFVVDVEADGHFRMNGMNTAAERVFGYPASRIAGKTFEECYSERMVALLSEHYRICVRLGEAHQFDDFADLAGGRKWFRTTLSPCIDPESKRVARIMAISQNITSVMLMVERAQANALTDALTGLANRRRFDEAVERACEETVSSLRGFSLCVVDLDDLKGINDRFGHQAGDDAIRSAGAVLGDFVRPDELVARVGGDEFFLLLRAPDPGALEARLDALRAVTGPGLSIPGFRRLFQLSIGGAVWRPGDEAGEILALADAAMYAEKCSRRLSSRDGDPASPADALSP